MNDQPSQRPQRPDPAACRLSAPGQRPLPVRRPRPAGPRQPGGFPDLFRERPRRHVPQQGPRHRRAGRDLRGRPHGDQLPAGAALARHHRDRHRRRRIRPQLVQGGAGIFRDGVCCATGLATMVCMDIATRKSTPLPEEAIAKLSQWKIKGGADHDRRIRSQLQPRLSASSPPPTRRTTPAKTFVSRQAVQVHAASRHPDPPCPAGRYPLVLINHGSPHDASERPKMSPMAYLPQATEFARAAGRPSS